MAKIYIDNGMKLTRYGWCKRTEKDKGGKKLRKDRNDEE